MDCAASVPLRTPEPGRIRCYCPRCPAAPVRAADQNPRIPTNAAMGLRVVSVPLIAQQATCLFGIEEFRGSSSSWVQKGRSVQWKPADNSTERPAHRNLWGKTRCLGSRWQVGKLGSMATSDGPTEKFRFDLTNTRHITRVAGGLVHSWRPRGVVLLCTVWTRRYGLRAHAVR